MNKTVLMVAVVATLILLPASMASADSVDPLEHQSANADLSQDPIQMACQAAGGINCAVAVALPLGGCWKGICLGVGFGVVGHVSSIAVAGGGAYGTVNGELAGCNWKNGALTGGSCGDVVTQLECESMTVVAEGYLNPARALLDDLAERDEWIDVPLVPGTTAVAYADSPCASSSQSTAMNHEPSACDPEIHQEIRSMMTDQLNTHLEEITDSLQGAGVEEQGTALVQTLKQEATLSIEGVTACP